MTRSRTVVMLVAAVLGLSLAVATPANASYLPGSGSDFTPPGSSSSDSGTVTGSDDSCALYANSGGFGLTCAGGGAAKKVSQILGKQDVPYCWDELLTRNDPRHRYVSVDPGYLPYTQTCATGIVVGNTPYNQPNLQITQTTLSVKVGTRRCAKPSGGPQDDLPGGVVPCLEFLTAKQREVVDLTGQDDQTIPAIDLTRSPSNAVRTREDVAYTDTAVADGGSATTTRKINEGGVVMYATMNYPGTAPAHAGKPDFHIYPYGNDDDARWCDGTVTVSRNETRTDKPDACWFAYPQSSAGQPNSAYTFRAKATWTVYVQDQNGTHAFATFTKPAQLVNTVRDIQTIVVN